MSIAAPALFLFSGDRLWLADRYLAVAKQALLGKCPLRDSASAFGRLAQLNAPVLAIDPAGSILHLDDAGDTIGLSLLTES